MPSYKLRYFDVRARGEFIRYMFVLKGVAFEDARFSFETWPKEKPNTPHDQLPVLTIDGEDFTESLAAARYLAREFGLMGKSSRDAYEVDRAIGIWQDILNDHVKFHFEKDEKIKEDKLKDFNEKLLPRVLANLEKHFTGRKTNGYVVGNSLSLGDAAVYDSFDNRVSDAELGKYPHVNAIIRNFKANSRVKAYLTKRGDQKI